MIDGASKARPARTLVVAAYCDPGGDDACFDSIVSSLWTEIYVIDRRIAAQTKGKKIIDAIAMKSGRCCRAIVVAPYAVIVPYGAQIVAVLVQTLGQQLLGKEIWKTDPLFASERISDYEFQVAQADSALVVQVLQIECPRCNGL